MKTEVTIGTDIQQEGQMPAISTLLQKLESMSGMKVRKKDVASKEALEIRRCYPPLKVMAHPSMKSFNFYDNPYRALYGSNAEFELSSPGVELGSLCHLSHLENPTLTQLSQAYGENTAAELLLLHVSVLNMSSGAYNRMDAPAMLLCCKDILSVFGHLTIAEFCVFCARMRTLRYVRKRSDYVFSGDTIMQGMQEFAEDLSVARKRFDSRVDTSDGVEYISHEQARQTEAYRDAYKAELERISEGSACVQKQDAAGPRRVPAVRLSEAEFSRRKRDMIEMMKKQYDIP